MTPRLLVAQLTKPLALMIAAFVLLFGVLAFVSYKSFVPHEPLVADEENRLEACRTKTLAAVKPNPIELKTLAGIHGLCYVEVNEANALRAFTQQTSALYNQQNQLPIILWMVVAITLSGVALAGLQLYGAYSLATTGKGTFAEQGGSVSVAKGGLSVSSTVTGVAILAISFGFFFVFVKDVYLIQEVKITANASATGQAPVLTGWGLPPVASFPKGVVNAPAQPTEDRASAK
jgi:hypothetical protein